jgi:hypothetical protein
LTATLFTSQCSQTDCVFSANQAIECFQNFIEGKFYLLYQIERFCNWNFCDELLVLQKVPEMNQTQNLSFQVEVSPFADFENARKYLRLSVLDSTFADFTQWKNNFLIFFKNLEEPLRHQKLEIFFQTPNIFDRIKSEVPEFTLIKCKLQNLFSHCFD